MFLFGEAGTGKTCAALCLLDRVADSLYMTVDDAVDAVLRQDANLWELVAADALVVLDELGLRAKDSDLEYVAVKRVADARGQRPTVYISNLPPKAMIDSYDERIYSRICSGTCFKLGGRDKRMEPK